MTWYWSSYLLTSYLKRNRNSFSKWGCTIVYTNKCMTTMAYLLIERNHLPIFSSFSEADDKTLVFIHFNKLYGSDKEFGFKECGISYFNCT